MSKQIKDKFIEYAKHVGLDLTTEEVENIIEFMETEDAPKRIYKMPYDHAKIMEYQINKVAVEEFVDSKYFGSDTEIVLNFGDGFRVVKLVGENAYKREGFLMRNCVGDYYGKDVEVYSLRDANNIHLCTIEKDKIIKGNVDNYICPRYIGYVVKFLKHIGMSVGDFEMLNLGYINVEEFTGELSSELFNGKYHPREQKLLAKNGEEFVDYRLWNKIPLIEFTSETSFRINFDIKKFIIKATDKIIELIKNQKELNSKKNKNESECFNNSGKLSSIASSGDYAQIVVSGDYSRIGSSGDHAYIASSGHSTHISSSGNCAHICSYGDSVYIGLSGFYTRIGSTGNYASIASSGEYDHIGNSGDYAQIVSSGCRALIGSSGVSSQIVSSGHGTQIGVSGDFSLIGSSGDFARIGISGHNAHISSSGKSAHICSSGESNDIGISGVSAHIGSSGDFARIGSSGQSASIVTSGNYTRIGIAGNSTRVLSSGHSAHISSSGDFSRIELNGQHSIGINSGNRSIIKGKKGCWITLAEWGKIDGNIIPTCVKSAQIDGDILKEDTFYKLENGEFVEVK